MAAIARALQATWTYRLRPFATDGNGSDSGHKSQRKLSGFGRKRRSG